MSKTVTFKYDIGDRVRNIEESRDLDRTRFEIIWTINHACYFGGLLIKYSCKGPDGEHLWSSENELELVPDA